jgi:excisionase family DNA binding protein
MTTVRHHHPIEPRGLTREQAAHYVGVGTTVFDAMVTDGRMPEPRIVGRRTIWDRQALDMAFDNLPQRGGDTGADQIDAMLG